MKTKWLDRSCFTMPIYFSLATSQKILDKELERLKFKGSIGLNVGASATTNFLTNASGETCAMVCLFEYQQYDIKQCYALLTHEAVHIFQSICDSMGEHNPSKEFEAWTIQKISQDLFYEFDRQIKLGSKCKSKRQK